MEFNKKPNEENVFFYVYVENLNWPTQKHNWLASAKKEAERLVKTTWKKTYILQAIKSYDLIETNYLNNSKVWKHKK